MIKGTKSPTRETKWKGKNDRSENNFENYIILFG